MSIGHGLYQYANCNNEETEASGTTLGKWLSQDLNPGPLTPEARATFLDQHDSLVFLLGHLTEAICQHFQGPRY